jgi:hypothetical protein
MLDIKKSCKPLAPNVASAPQSPDREREGTSKTSLQRPQSQKGQERLKARGRAPVKASCDEEGRSTGQIVKCLRRTSFILARLGGFSQQKPGN